MKIDLYKMTIDVSMVLAVRISRMPARRFFNVMKMSKKELSYDA